MAQLAHCARFDLANALAGEVEVFADFFERAGFATIEAETKFQNFAFALVERSEEALNLFGQQRSGRDLER